jgi:hypothetical protein
MLRKIKAQQSYFVVRVQKNYCSLFEHTHQTHVLVMLKSCRAFPLLDDLACDIATGVEPLWRRMHVSARSAVRQSPLAMLRFRLRPRQLHQNLLLVRHPLSRQIATTRP